MSISLWPHGLQPASHLCPWDFPGKNTGVGCHFLLQDLRECSVLIVPPESTLFSQTFFYLSKKIANATSSGSFLSRTIPIKMNHSFFWVPIDSVFFKASGQNLLVDIEINST